MIMESVFQEFCQQTSFQFPRESDSTLQNLDADVLLHSNFRTMFRPATICHLSDLIEEAIVNGAGITEVHASFVSYEGFTERAYRYAEIAVTVMGLWVYAPCVVTLNVMPRSAFINTTGTPLSDYWWIIARGPSRSMCLFAEQIPCDCPDRQQYRGFYTTADQTAIDALKLLHAALPDEVPEPTVWSVPTSPQSNVQRVAEVVN